MTPAPRIALVTGATGQLGFRLLPRLAEMYDEVVAVSRNPAAPPGRQRRIAADLERDADVARVTAAVGRVIAAAARPPAAGSTTVDLFHLAPLWLLFPLLDRLAAAAPASRAGEVTAAPAGPETAAAGADRHCPPGSRAHVPPAAATVRPEGQSFVAGTTDIAGGETVTASPTGLGLARLIAFGSTSMFTKMDSGCPEERRIAAALMAAEDRLREICDRHGIAWTILRPTMVYGAGMDRTVTLIRRMIRRFGFFPVAGRARGRRQPVHVDDLVDAVLAVFDRPETRGRDYNLGGGEILTYRELVARIFRREGMPPRILPLPPLVLYLLLRGAGGLALTGKIPLAMIRRQNRDLCFDNRPAAADFGWAPRGFAG
ncbi:MAG: NAD-dependent epimerase/dehydratase family protein [Deltaproteobacteria bacterium]|nr:NAD-dependent epimerase/dehydratase family protein [Candidatus Anaeroferrophillacea bacterium]